MSAPSEEELKTADEAMKRDQEEKKAVVIDTLAKHCRLSANGVGEQELRAIRDALVKGHTLEAKTISGGKTNFSYKVYVKESPDVAVFAKICFNFALWNPDRSVDYDLERVENEYKVMKRFREMMGADRAPVAKPLMCVDVSDSMKVLVTEWASADEQWANQFVDGVVDRRVIPKAAEALATLTCADVDPMFNDNVRPCMRSLFPACKDMVGEIVKKPTEGDDACTQYLRKMSKERYNSLVDRMDERYMCREVLCHSDTHMFNMLVEKKPSVENLETFGPNGNLVICDWEMAFCGPKGRDAGIHQMWPIACSVAHAAHGRRDIAYDMLDCCSSFWDGYAKALLEKGKDADFLTDMFQDSLGWMGMFPFVAIYLMGLFVDVLPLEGLSDEIRKEAVSAIGIIGLRLLDLGFGDGDNIRDLDLDGLRRSFGEIVSEGIESLLSASALATPVRRPRRASAFRSMGRRVSDASLYDEMARRFSVDPHADRRASAFDVTLLRASFLAGIENGEWEED